MKWRIRGITGRELRSTLTGAHRKRNALIRLTLKWQMYLGSMQMMAGIQATKDEVKKSDGEGRRRKKVEIGEGVVL